VKPEDVAHCHGAKSAHTLTRLGSPPSSGEARRRQGTFACAPHCGSIGMDGVWSDCQHSLQSGGGHPGVVPLTAIEQFWPAGYRSLQWEGNLPGGTVGSWRSWW
jgi:hypothetical protein